MGLMSGKSRNSMTLKEALEQGTEQLQQNHIAEAALDAWYLLAYVTGMGRAEYYLHQNERMEIKSQKRYCQLIDRRSKHIPLQHLTGEQEFMGLSFRVTSAVLVPRQDTECLVEAVLPVAKGKRILDVCTGSGCIAISLKCLGGAAVCDAVDLSEEALQVARENAESLQADVTLWQSDMFQQVTGEYDVIVSNPPYIRPEVIETLMPEVWEYEPRMALDGGTDGLDFYRILAENSRRHLKENGWLFLEIGYDQGEAVAELLHACGYQEISIRQDLTGKDRIATARWKIS